MNKPVKTCITVHDYSETEANEIDDWQIKSWKHSKFNCDKKHFGLQKTNRKFDRPTMHRNFRVERIS